MQPKAWKTLFGLFYCINETQSELSFASATSSFVASDDLVDNPHSSVNTIVTALDYDEDALEHVINEQSVNSSQSTAIPTLQRQQINEILSTSI